MDREHEGSQGGEISLWALNMSALLHCLQGQVVDPTIGSKSPHHSMEVLGVAVKRKVEGRLRDTCLAEGQLSGAGKEIPIFPLSLRMEEASWHSEG